MKSFVNIGVMVLLVFQTAIADAQQRYPYQDASISVEKRVNDLVKRMTLEEKVFLLQSEMKFMKEYKDRDFRIGNVRNIAHFMHKDPPTPVSSSACAEAINADTRKSIEVSRWGIPVLQHGEALHVANWGNATCFPMSISMGATFDDDIYFKVGEVVAKELRAEDGKAMIHLPLIMPWIKG